MRSKPKYALCADCPARNNRLAMPRGNVGEQQTQHCDVMIVGEGPGTQEQRTGMVFVGRTGQLLMELLDMYPLRRFWLTNTFYCGAYEDKDKKRAAECCAPRLMKEIELFKPRLIIAMGNIPCGVLLNKPSGITKHRGQLFPVTIESHDTVVMPVVHPAAALRDADRYLPGIQDDLKKASELVYNAEGSLVDAARGEHPRISEIEYEVTSDYQRVLADAEQSRFAVLDLETVGTDYTRGSIICAVIATDDNIYVIPGDTMRTNGFIDALKNCKAKWSGHNAKFDRNWIKHKLGIWVDFAHDSMLLHYLYDERRGTHGLKEICTTLFGAEDWDAPIQAMLKALPRGEERTYDKIPREALYRYAANDGYWQRFVTGYYLEKLHENERKTWLYENLIMPLLRALSSAESAGVLIDLDHLHKIQKKYAERIRRERVAIFDSVDGLPEDFNPNSTQQVAKVLFDDLGVSPIDGRSTSVKKVLSLIPNPPPFVGAIIRYRDVKKFHSTYAKGFEKLLGSDNRIHASFNIAGTVTGRLSSSSPNLQNVPSRDPERKKDIRDAFVADPGKVWVDTDFSQIEMRCIAVLSGDPWLIQCYRDGRDMHGEMAEMAFGPNWTKLHRSLAKGLNFGLAYGRTVAGILGDGTLDLTREEAENIARTFYERMPKVRSFQEKVRQFVFTYGFVDTPLGRTRHFPSALLARTEYEKESVFKEAFNTVI